MGMQCPHLKYSDCILLYTKTLCHKYNQNNHSSIICYSLMLGSILQGISFPGQTLSFIQVTQFCGVRDDCTAPKTFFALSKLPSEETFPKVLIFPVTYDTVSNIHTPEYIPIIFCVHVCTEFSNIYIDVCLHLREFFANPYTYLVYTHVHVRIAWACS